MGGPCVRIADLGCEAGPTRGCEAVFGPGDPSSGAATDVGMVLDLLTSQVETAAGGGDRSGLADFQPVRCSPRLALREASTVLDSAVARKARLQDCSDLRVEAGMRPSRKRISKLSRKCGVSLCATEADSFLEFAPHGL